MLLRVVPPALMLIGALMLFQRPAYGYTDPGTGLLAVQAVGSALAATGWYLRRKIYALFHTENKTVALDETHESMESREDVSGS